MYAQLLSSLQKSEEQLNDTREELTLTREVKEAKDAIIRLESHIRISSSYVLHNPYPLSFRYMGTFGLMSHSKTFV